MMKVVSTFDCSVNGVCANGDLQIISPPDNRMHTTRSLRSLADGRPKFGMVTVLNFISDRPRFACA
jgi:hypothetical protein